MVTLGFILFRELVKLYVARQANQEGSRIRTKLVLGALALSCFPVFFLVLFSFEVLNRSVDRWFTRPGGQQVELFVDVRECAARRDAGRGDRARPRCWHAAGDAPDPGGARRRCRDFLERFAQGAGAESAAIYAPAGERPIDSWMGDPALANDNGTVHASAP